MAELRDDGRARLHRRRQARRQRRACCARRCSTSACAAACSRCTRRTRRSRAPASMHEGAVSALLGVAGHPEHQRVDDGRPRRARSPATRAARPHPAPELRARRSTRSRWPRTLGVRVTLRGQPHHLCLTDEAVRTLDTSMKMNPPLRDRGRPPGAHRRACATGVIDCVATDHAPHARDEKEVPFEQAPMGTTGLETAFAALYTELVRARRAARSTLIVERMTARRRAARPADPARSRPDEPANLCLVDLDADVDRRRGRLREPLGELLLRRPRAARPRPADGRRRRGRLPRARFASPPRRSRPR